MRGQQFFEGMDPPAPPVRPKMTSAVFNSYSAEHRGLQSAGARQVIKGSGWPEKKPVGMRGSLVDRAKLATRLEHKSANQGRWQSLRDRMHDEDAEENYDSDPELHPKTGLPTSGSIYTHVDENNYEPSPSIGMGHGYVPHELSYHGSTSSARRQAGTPGWIPVPGLRTQQETVSAGRVHQAMEDPATTSSPRLPHRELPHVYMSEATNPAPGTGLKQGDRTHTLIDGNHRASANILNGHLFMEANVLTDDDIPKVAAITRRHSQRVTAAMHNPNVDADAVERRTNRNLYGEDDY